MAERFCCHREHQQYAVVAENDAENWGFITTTVSEAWVPVL